MDRRKFIVGAGITLHAPLAGCLDQISNSLGTGIGNGTGNENETDNDGGNGNGDDPAVIEEDPRTDEPPYKITPPDPPEDSEGEVEWNEEYLGEHMATTPSLAFEHLSVRHGLIPGHGLTGEGYWVDVLTSADERDDMLDLDAAGEETRSRLTDIDFDESVLVVVETGYGSGSIGHQWTRIENTEDELHLYGYHIEPYILIDTLSTHTSVLVVERPDADINLARASLTVSEDRRVHFNLTEGVVELEREVGTGSSDHGEPTDEDGLEPPRHLVLQNEHDEEHTVTVTRDSESVHTEDYSLKPDKGRRVKDVIIEEGEYRLEAKLEDSTTESLTQSVTCEVLNPSITITVDGELAISYDVE